MVPARQSSLSSLRWGAGVPVGLCPPEGGSAKSSVAGVGVLPQGLQSNTDQLYCLILKKSFTSLSLSFLFISKSPEGIYRYILFCPSNQCNKIHFFPLLAQLWPHYVLCCF